MGSSDNRQARSWDTMRSPYKFRKELRFMQRIIDREREAHAQTLRDYDMVEAELKELLKERDGDAA